MSIAADGSSSGTVYAATTAGVYKSADGGNDWSLVLADAGFHTTTLVDPNNSNNAFLSAALGRGGSSWRSTDGGRTWTQMSVEGPLAIQPGNSNTLYSITENASIAVSYDSGLTWATTTTPYQAQMDLAVLPSGQVVISTAGRGLVEFTPK